MKEFNVSECCGKMGWVLKREQPAMFISQDDFNKLKIKQNEPVNKIS